MASTINADNGVVSGVSGINYTGDNSGVMALQTNGNTAVTIDSSRNVSLANNLTVTGNTSLANNLTVTGNLTTTGYINAPNTFGFRNRLINGNMVIDQRNAGANVVVSSTSALTYGVDRWFGFGNVASKFSIQQNAGAVTPPAGYTNYFGATSLTAYTVGTGDFFVLGQKIEGYNIADLGFGTVNAKTITLSFQVYSSLTGTFGGAVCNGAQTRSYPFTFTISSANTWTPITVTIPGDTGGTWVSTNAAGLNLWFGLGEGSSWAGTAGSWTSNDWRGATGAVNVVSTSGATFYITGVQLEKGSTATSFDYRPYSAELAMCQRYYENNYGVGYAIGSASSYPNNYGVFFQSFNTTNGQKHVYDWFKVPKRAVPTVTYYDFAGNAGKMTSIDSGGTNTNNVSIGYTPLNQNNLAAGATATWYGAGFFWVASAEL